MDFQPSGVAATLFLINQLPKSSEPVKHLLREEKFKSKIHILKKIKRCWYFLTVHSLVFVSFQGFLDGSIVTAHKVLILLSVNFMAGRLIVMP